MNTDFPLIEMGQSWGHYYSYDYTERLGQGSHPEYHVELRHGARLQRQCCECIRSVESGLWSVFATGGF